MNKNLFRILAAVVALHFMAGRAQAQWSLQRISFSLVGEYQTNTFATNSTAGTNWTEEHPVIRPILITTANVIKAIALDLDGTNFRTWIGAGLVREVNLSNQTEAIFLRKGTNKVDVSSFFDGSFSNNFQGTLTNNFPGLTNNITDQETNENLLPGTAGLIPQTTLYRGYLYQSATNTNPADVTTNYLRTSSLHFVSLNTVNMKFNLVAVGDGDVKEVSGVTNGITYKSAISSENLGAAGAYYLNITSNNQESGGTNIPPAFVTGPIHGTFATGTPAYSNKQ